MEWTQNLNFLIIGDLTDKKREKKLIGKNNKRGTVSTSMSKASPEPKESDQDDSPSTVNKYPRNRVKKKDQYRNQVIEDQFGVFEYDNDKEGYLKARKRMLNRKSKYYLPRCWTFTQIWI